MSRVRTWILTTACVGLVVAGVGCGGRKTVPVKGVVLFDGKALANAFVQLHSQEPGGRDATGRTDDKGEFHLSTFHPKDGAFPGSYRVTVHYSEPIPIPPGLTRPADIQNAMREAAQTHKPSLVVPPIYAQPDQTPLQHKVPDDGDMRIDLRSAGR